MIGYSLRVGALLTRHAVFGPRAEPGEPFIMKARAWPWLCDVYRHLNNAIYLRLAEDARWAWTAKTPLLQAAMKNRWAFLVAGADIVYRRPIELMSTFDIVCRVEGADDKWLYMSQEFILPSEKSACRILIRAMLKGPNGAIAPSDILSLTGYTPPPPTEELQRLTALSNAQLQKMNEG